MNVELTVSLWTLLRLVVVALLCIGVVRGLRLAIQVAPLLPATRRSLVQAWPLVGLLVGASYVMWAVQQLVRSEPLLSALAVLGVVFGLFWLTRVTLMDAVTGALLRAGGSVGVGDSIRLDEVEGRVSHLGYRVLGIATRGGDEVLVPYSRVAGASMVRTAATDGAHRHTFRLAATGRDLPERVRQRALLCHWSSVARLPTVNVEDDGTLEVTVFALAAEHGAAIEAFVRRGLQDEGADV
jgi:small-conductance mechanosensitive channel